jgi:alkylation response protein AidB-like acyl-CoA dehydrogenase
MSAAEDRLEGLRLIRDSVAAIVPPGGDLKRIRALRFTEPGFDPAVLREMGELGWLGLRVCEADGGAGLGLAELCAVAEGIGAGLVPEPLIGVAVIAPLLPEPWRTPVILGEKLVLPAWQEKANEFPPPHNPVPQADGEKTVSAKKLFIPMASGADAFLVTTSTGLALVPRDAPGLTLDLDRTQDGGHFGTLTLSGTPATPVDGALPLDEAALATAAYLLGVMDRAFALTLDYLRTRQQFGRAIGSFQVLQHRCADLRIQIALTRASVEAAAATYDAHGPTPLARAAISRAKARAAEASMLVTRQAIQLHGGIGYTDEADIGLYLRKAMVLANLYGSAAIHRARYAALAPDQDE